MLIAHELFVAAAGGSRTLTVLQGQSARRANAVRWLGEAWRHLEVGTSEAGGFTGGPHAASFSTWALTADGWAERRQIRVAQGEGVVYARTERDSFVLIAQVTALEFDYLLEPGADSRWVRTWESPVSAPIAVRMRISRRAGDGRRATDTLLFLVKSRG